MELMAGNVQSDFHNLRGNEDCTLVPIAIPILSEFPSHPLLMSGAIAGEKTAVQQPHFHFGSGHPTQFLKKRLGPFHCVADGNGTCHVLVQYRPGRKLAFYYVNPACFLLRGHGGQFLRGKYQRLRIQIPGQSFDHLPRERGAHGDERDDAAKQWQQMQRARQTCLGFK